MKAPYLLLFALVSTATLQAAPEINRHNLHNLVELVEQGADINLGIGYARKVLAGEDLANVPRSQYYPLDAAIDVMRTDQVEFLLNKGAKIRGSEVGRAAFLSSHHAALHITQHLLDAGADPNTSEHAMTPGLSGAAFRNNLPLVKLLLAHPDIEVNMRDIDGYTPLMHAANRGHTTVVKLLLEAGADPTLATPQGATALKLLAEEIEQRKKLLETLKAAVAKK